MPSADEHQENYLHNKKLLNSELFRQEGEYSDWFVTILFYEAVHLIERELAKHSLMPFHSSDHNVRMGWVSKTAWLNKIIAEYSTLYNQSIRARYKCAKFSSQDVAGLEQKFYVIENHLNQTSA